MSPFFRNYDLLEVRPSSRIAFRDGGSSAGAAAATMNLYQRLQVDSQASPEVIKRAYRTLLKHARMHPDLGGDEEEAKALIEAYSVISDPQQRAQYDRELRYAEAYRYVASPPQYILFCPACGKPNRISDEALIPQARCAICRRKLVPSGAQLSGQGHERTFKLGMYLYEKGLLDRALREFQAAVRLDPGNSTFRYWLGRCYYRRRMYEKAVAEFKAAVAVKPDSFQFQFWLGQASYQFDDLPTSVSHFETAARLRPDHDPTFHRLGTIYYNLRDFTKSVQAFTRAAQLNPQSLQFQRWLGLAYYALDEPDGALQAFRNAERLSPDDRFAAKYIRILTERTA